MYSPTLKKMRPFGLETDQDAIAARRGRAVLLAEELADALFAEAEPGNTHPPLAALARLNAAGLMTAALPVRLGGLGLGTEPGGHLPLLRVLSALGGSDLALGRLYEGHVNALILIHAYGSPEQRRIAAEDAHAGKLFAVWNTGEPTPMRVGGYNGNLTLHGVKAFATGAAFAQRPIITAEHRGWQMILPRMESARVADAVQIDRDSWHPLGMESSGSLTIDFSGAGIAASDLIGQPGDFFREPLFRGGSIRFAAVQAGAVVRLARFFADSLTARGRQGDPYQIARLGEIELLAQDAVLWIERAAAVAESCLFPDADPQAVRRMIRCGNMTRLAIERAGIATMQHIVSGVGAHGLLRPARFERILRNLTMYLRQPNPDGTLADVGRSAVLEESSTYWLETEDTPIG